MEQIGLVKHIYLHIGRGKTGTTAIQAAMAQNDEALRQSGVHYVRADGGAKGSGHQNLAKSFITNLPVIMTSPSQPGRVRELVSDEICSSPSDVIVLSSENFPLADIGQVARYFDTMPIDNEVKIAFFVRTQDELAESEYNQMVKLKRETRSCKEYAETALEGVDYFEECENWAKHFGQENLICRVYDGAADDALKSFLSCLPVPIEFPVKLTVPADEDFTNRSIGFKALSVARLLNSVEIDNRLQVYRRIFEQMAENDLPALMFNVEEAAAFRARFAGSNERFSARYLGQQLSEIGGRRYTDSERQSIRDQIAELGLLS